MFKRRKDDSFGSQDFFCLMAIPIAAIGIPHLLIGEKLAAQYGAGTAVCSILVGNLLLWLIASGVIAMMEQKHIDAIDNIKKYFGWVGGLIAAVVFLVIFLNAFALQINFSMQWLKDQLQWTPDLGTVLRIGAGMGLLVSLLSVGGFRLLKYVALFGLPFFVCYQIYTVFAFSKQVVFTGTWGLSFSAVLLVIVATFPKVLMFPTLFRYSKSNAHSYMALALFAILAAFSEIATVFGDFSRATMFFVFLPMFVLLKMACSNLFDIYLASACWEVIVHRFTVAKEYAIIGLFGTLVYTFVQVSSPVEFLQTLTNDYLASLGIVLLIAYLMRMMIRHRPRPLEKWINLATWLFGCVTATVYEIGSTHAIASGLIVAMSASSLFFLGVLFVEETTWAIRTKLQQIQGQ